MSFGEGRGIISERTVTSTSFDSQRTIRRLIVLASTGLALLGGLSVGTLVPGYVALGAIAALALAFIIVARPFYGFLLFVILTFGRAPSLPLVGPLTVQLLLATLLFTATLFHAAINKRVRNQLWVFRNGAFTRLAFFTGLVVLSSAYHGSAMMEPYIMVTNLALFVAATVLIQSWEQLISAIVAMFFGAMLTVLGGWIYFFADPQFTFPAPRLDGYYGTEIIMALMGLIAACVGIAFLKSRRGAPWMRIGLVIASTAAVIVVAAAVSRGVFVAGLGLLTVILLRPGKRPALRYCAIAIVATVAIFFAYEELTSEAQAVIHLAGSTDQLQTVSSGRTMLYKAAFRMLPENPITGIGWGQFRTRWFHAATTYFVRLDGVPEFNVHCSYLQVQVELGIVGLVVYVLWTLSYLGQGSAALRALRARGEEARPRALIVEGLLFAVSGLLLHSIFDNVARGQHRAHILLTVFLVLAHHLVMRDEGGGASEIGAAK